MKSSFKILIAFLVLTNIATGVLLFQNTKKANLYVGKFDSLGIVSNNQLTKLQSDNYDLQKRIDDLKKPTNETSSITPLELIDELKGGTKPKPEKKEKPKAKNNKPKPKIELKDRRVTKQEVKNSYRIGAICKDGTRSYATGRGACSWHGGVAYWLYSK